MTRKKVGKRKSASKSVKLRPRRLRPVDRIVEGDPELWLFEYEIDFDPIPDPDYDALPAEWRAEMQWVWEEPIEDFEAAIPILERGRERAPHIPRLWNLLAVAYQMTGRRDEAHELHDEAFRRFPDYLFARINLETGSSNPTSRSGFARCSASTCCRTRQRGAAGGSTAARSSVSGWRSRCTT